MGIVAMCLVRMIVMGMIVMDGVMRRAIVQTGRRRLPGETRPCAGKRDQAGQNGAKQRKKDDGLKHRCVSPSSY